MFFAHPYSPWERGINENTNGLLRRVLPKGSDLSIHTQEQLDAIAFHHYAKPRKSLGWKAPAELFLHSSRPKLTRVKNSNVGHKLRKSEALRACDGT